MTCDKTNRKLADKKRRLPRGVKTKGSICCCRAPTRRQVVRGRMYPSDRYVRVVYTLGRKTEHSFPRALSLSLLEGPALELLSALVSLYRSMKNTDM